MSKYSALGAYLRSQPFQEVPMTFADIEKIVGAKLPKSAFVHRPWWSNNDKNSVMTRVWLDAGFRTARVDMENRKLVFERIRGPRGFSEEKKQFESDPQKQSRHPMIGALKGTFTIEDGYDLTQPAEPEWADLIDKKYGPEKH